MDKVTTEYRKAQIKPVWKSQGLLTQQQGMGCFKASIKIVSGDGKATNCLNISLAELVSIYKLLTK